MSFHSVYADRIWKDLYSVYVPDFVTMNRDYIRKFGVPSSGNKDIDKMMATNTTFVKIPIIKILEYFENGVEVQIPSRPDMINIHKHIEDYLSEWREHIKYDINLNRMEHKTLLLGLERLSKLIYDKAYPKEVVTSPLSPQAFGLVNALHKHKPTELSKPDYNGISALLKPSKPAGRF